MKLAILMLNAALLVLAIGIAGTLIGRGNPWVLISAYWCVTVVKNFLQMVKEG